MSLPREGGSHAQTAPAASAWIVRWLARLPAGARVLDFASGSGRHALEAARLGLRVLAADRDSQALDRLVARADTGIAARIEVRVVDLESGPWPFNGERFDAVVVANYLFRPRFDLLASLIAPGGLLVYETFARGNERYGRPSNPAFLLETGELLDRSRRAGLTVLAYETGLAQRPAPALVQRVCAVRSRAAEAVWPLG